MNLTQEFIEYLKDNEFSYNTRKNYVSDLSTFVDYLISTNQYFSLLTLPFVLSQDNLKNYQKRLVATVPLSTVNRRLASLRKFAQFAIEKNLISSDDWKGIDNTPLTDSQKLDKEVERFRLFLKQHGSTPNTVKVYVSDVKYYLGLRTTAAQSPASQERRRHSIAKFLKWEASKNIEASLLNSLPVNSDTQSVSPIPMSSNFPATYNKAKVSWKTIFQAGIVSFALFTGTVVVTALVTNARSGAVHRVGFLTELKEKLLSLPPTSRTIDPVKPASKGEEDLEYFFGLVHPAEPLDPSP